MNKIRGKVKKNGQSLIRMADYFLLVFKHWRYCLACPSGRSLPSVALPP